MSSSENPTTTTTPKRPEPCKKTIDAIQQTLKEDKPMTDQFPLKQTSSDRKFMLSRTR
jgi:hypothetical protein